MDDDVEHLLEAPYRKEEPRREVNHKDVGKEGSEKPIANGDDTQMDIDNASAPEERKPRQNGHHPDEEETHKQQRSKSPSGRHRRRHRSRSKDRRSSRRSSRSGSRHRRSSRSPRRRSRDRREREKERDRDYDRDYRDRERDRDRDRDRGSRRDRDRDNNPYYREPPPSRRDDGGGKRGSTSRDRHSRSPSVNEDERDRRTVFVRQLAARLKERELKEFLTAAGRVRDVKIIYDRISGRSKGIGYVEFYEESSVQKAIAMTGQKLLGLPIAVELTEAEKNRLAEIAANRGDVNQSRIYIGSLHHNITEDDVKAIFEPFGPMELLTMHKDDTGRSRGFAFIQYRRPEDAKQAADKMNGFELGGRALKVSVVSERTNPAAAHALNALTNLDDLDGSGFALNSHARAELMAKLARDDSLLASSSQAAAPQSMPKVSVPQIATRCVLLKNMFDPAEETEPNWEKDIEEDVKQECSKYGQVQHVAVDKDSAGFIYMKFSSAAEAQAAVNSLNNRFFAGKQITATFVPDAIYSAQFKLAA
ncbi:hypothetical protein SeMB42_g00393 [Synchytrium endobioticum]|uniref:RRM domain-containing protein n=1 Tax=Synchytrium endobioticum TaxID=286115 RepID=A0A507D7V3_9FUNG|nr:hypothetical protein SeLEV6574_g02547 [Synchytrium endobioticum]TPX54192.1 hypothetical protein SeMB42_g00393 [Synchytrium endobioticum]